MGLFDSLKNSIASAARAEATRAVNGAVNNAVNNAVNGIGKGRNETKTFTFQSIPRSVAELKNLPEASLDTAFKTTALAILSLLCFEENPEACYEMLDFLNGPDDVSMDMRNFISERLTGMYYKPFSFFKGATVQNSYKPTMPLTISVSSNSYSFDEENWATMYVKSAGDDSFRPVKLRKKPSTGQWFITELQCLGNVKTPVADDPWA